MPSRRSSSPSLRPTYGVAALPLVLLQIVACVAEPIRPMYASLMRADLFFLGKAESTYYSTRRVFAAGLDSLTSYRVSGGNTVRIIRADTAGWAAIAKTQRDSTITCRISGSPQKTAKATCTGL